MMLRTTVAALAIVLAAGFAAPAQAEPVGVNGCGATAPANHGRATCTFVALPGNYTLQITSQARYAWAEVTCVPLGGYLFVGVWDTEGGYASTTGYLPGGVCTLEVAAGSGGPATASVS